MQVEPFIVHSDGVRTKSTKKQSGAERGREREDKPQPKGKQNRQRDTQAEDCEGAARGLQVPVPVAAINFYLSSSFKEFQLAYSLRSSVCSLQSAVFSLLPGKLELPYK